MWNNAAESKVSCQAKNPFNDKVTTGVGSDNGPQKGDAAYGTAPEGSKTAQRAAAAKLWVEKEVAKLIAQIKKMATANEEGQLRTTFGELFYAYQDISDTLVGILMRAKKRKELFYKGDMLFQGVHDAVEIVLL